jgi:hypothetical protein
MGISQVIGWKFNNQAGMSTKGGVITAFPNGIPTQADQDLWTTEYEAHLASTEYARNRAEAYPSLADQLDDIYHNGVAGWKISIKAVKDQYPKT